MYPRLHQDDRLKSWAPDPPAPRDAGVDSLRLWISDQRWISLLEQIARESVQRLVDERRNPAEPRYASQIRCILRLGYPGQTPGIYLVRCHNVSSGGMGFLHGGFIQPGTRCTLGLQAIEGDGGIVSGRIAWCRQIQPEAFDVGVQFDQSVDVLHFLEPDEPLSA